MCAVGLRLHPIHPWQVEDGQRGREKSCDQGRYGVMATGQDLLKMIKLRAALALFVVTGEDAAGTLCRWASCGICRQT